MEKRKVQFSLVYRDMFQSSGKFQPRKDQLERIAPVIIKMGCFARVETNDGEKASFRQKVQPPRDIFPSRLGQVNPASMVTF